ncbi:MAG TPA: acetylxylan esterase [Anaerolineaceae bacterium]|nr:acetylxylan esterase [Anaerolineaceae bacterium]
MFFDLPLEQLESYKPNRQEPDDFSAFWEGTLKQMREKPLAVESKQVDFGLSIFETYDVTFNGYGDQPVKAWYILPAGCNKDLPCVVEYIGYGGGRGFPYDWLLWSGAGYATFVMDTRGQGSTWLQGDTADIPDVGSSPHIPGFMTLGILQPQQYYYYRVFCDAVRAVEAARSMPRVRADQVVVCGKSQGGGISLAMSGLIPDLAAVLTDVPFLCHFKRAVAITDTAPYNEIRLFCKTHRDKKDQVFHTLSYFDGMNFSCRSNAPALFSVGLMDTVCPPSTVFAAYNHYAGEKQIRIYDFNEHDGGGSHHEFEQIQFLKEIFK